MLLSVRNVRHNNRLTLLVPPPFISETDVVFSPHLNAVVAAALITANHPET